MITATPEEIQDAVVALEVAQNATILPTLRLRALRNETLMQPGDSFNVAALMEAIDKVNREFGGRNLRAM
jgi:hypothetical protein